MPADTARLRELIRARSFATGDFTLASGRKSNLYFNLKPTMMLPEGAFLCAEAFLARISDEEADYVGGLEMGAVPIIAAMAALAFERGRRLRTFFVRKKAKEHGTRALIEGLTKDESLAGQRIVMAEDVTTSGGSVLQAIKAAREAGGEVRVALSLIDRQEGAREMLAGHGVMLRSVFTAADFV
jgi:orotate phosphoribosyltransferase